MLKPVSKTLVIELLFNYKNRESHVNRAQQKVEQEQQKDLKRDKKRKQRVQAQIEKAINRNKAVIYKCDDCNRYPCTCLFEDMDLADLNYKKHWRQNKN